MNRAAPHEAAWLLGDRYQVAGEIGRGATSVVYEAHDIAARRTVAVKVMPLHSALNRARLLRELHALHRVRGHVGPRVFETVTSGECAAIVMERIDGTPLSDLMRGHQMHWRAAVALASSIGRATEWLHERAVVHRDLTPLNVLVTPAGNVRLIDFGSARSPGWDAVAQSALEARGTPAYAAPEQTAGYRPTAAADVYSLGTILVGLVRTSRPQAKAAGEVLRRIERLRAPIPSDRPGCGGAAAELLDDLIRTGAGCS